MTGQSPQRKPARQGVLTAAEKVAKIVPKTPLLPLEIRGRTVWCKAESLQPMGAFKLRGAWHRMTDLDEAERKAGVVAFSSGNHAQGVAWAARRLGVPAVIVMPSDAPQKKLENTRALGAEVILYDRMTEDRVAIADRIAAERGGTIVPPFDSAWIIEGQGSAGIEAAEQMGAEPDRIVTPCGGGGLAAGLALACPDAEIFGVEPEGWDDMAQSLAAGELLAVENPPYTSCDALQTLKPSSLTFEVLRDRKATILTVNEAEIAAAMRLAFDKLRLVVEPGGSVALAALLAGKVEPTDRTLIILSGGNVDAAHFAKIIAG